MPGKRSEAIAVEADTAFREGRYNSAGELFEQAAGLEPTRAVAAHYLHESAISFRRAGDPSRALRAAVAAVELAEPTQPDREALLRLTLGNALADAGQHAHARAELSRAHALFVAEGMAIESQYAALGEARCLVEMGQLADAATTFSHLAAPGHSSEVRSQALNNLALVRELEGDTKSAVVLLEEDVALCEAKRDYAGAVVALANMGRLSIDIGDAQAARRQLTRAIDLIATHDLELGIEAALRTALIQLDEPA